MTQGACDEYLRNRVLTATPEQLQMMLYDGAIRFARQGREALAAGDFETSCEKLLRAQRIILELQGGLRPEVNPSLCEQMSNLYTFAYNRLLDANMKRETAKIDEALKVLEHLRETWRLVLEKLQNERPPVLSSAVAPAIAPSQTQNSSVGVSLSVEG